MVLGHWFSDLKKNGVGPLLHTICKNAKKCINNLNVTAKTTKLLEENTRDNLHDTGFGKGFLEMRKKHGQPLPRRVGKKNSLNFKIKNSCTSKDTRKTMKQKLQNGKKYLQFIYLIMDLYLEYIRTLKTQYCQENYK